MSTRRRAPLVLDTIENPMAARAPYSILGARLTARDIAAATISAERINASTITPPSTSKIAADLLPDPSARTRRELFGEIRAAAGVRDV